MEKLAALFYAYLKALGREMGVLAPDELASRSLPKSADKV